MVIHSSLPHHVLPFPHVVQMLQAGYPMDILNLTTALWEEKFAFTTMEIVVTNLSTSMWLIARECLCMV